MDKPKISLRMPALRRSTRLGLPLLLGVVVLAACGDSNVVRETFTLPTVSPSPDSTRSTVFSGTVAGAQQSGTLEVTLQSTVASSSDSVHSRARTDASGHLTLIGVPDRISLAGTYDDVMRAVTLEGGGFSLSGQVAEDGAELSGRYTGPSGAGVFSTLNASTATVDTFCGTYSGSGSGTWNLALSNGTVSGTWSPGSAGVPGGTARGTLQGSNVRGTWSGGGDRGTFRGTRQDSRLNGTWRSSQSEDSGSFRGSSSCR
jgi:hypothetical protein